VRGFWDGYAAEYDSEPDHGLGDPSTRDAWRDLLRRWLPSRPSVVADLACGTGSLSVLCADLGHTVRAFDLSPQMVKRARAKNVHAGGQVSVQAAAVSAPPLAPSSIDVVLARHILWTLPDPWQALRTWAAAVRPGGRLLLVEGRWATTPAAREHYPESAPWQGGVTASHLWAAVAPLAAQVEVEHLTDPAYWGRTVTDERYLLAAELRP